MSKWELTEKAFEDFLSGAIGPRENLQGADGAIGLVQDRKVGERAADINAYAISHIAPDTDLLLPPKHRPCRPAVRT